MARRELSVAHRAWIVENLVAGVAAEVIAAQLATQIPPARAAREVAAVARSTLLPVCAQLLERTRRLELVCALARVHARGEPERTTVERRTLPPADEFFRAYWAPQRPAVFTDVTARWPALRKWTPAWFRRRFGGVTIDITSERDADPDYDMNYRAHTKRVRMDRFIDRVLAAGTTNDFYMVSNNRTMMRPAFRALLDDVRAPRGVIESPVRPAATSLWIGPGGTVTPLHHDTTNILFCQIFGRKRFELIAPTETVLLLDPIRGFYSPVDLDRRAEAAHPGVRDLLVKDVVLEPGDALFLPAGWWHRVTSLDVSISFSHLGFPKPNGFDWYRPGGATP